MFNPYQNQTESDLCPNCGEWNPPRASVCGHCGAVLVKSEQPVPPAEEARPASSPMTSNICPHCGEPNRPGVLICETCSASLVELNTDLKATTRIEPPSYLTRGRSSRLLETLDVRPISDSTPRRRPTMRVANQVAFETNMRLRIEINGYRNPIEFQVSDTEIVLGRRDGTSSPVDIDFAPYSAHQKGVSRHHAVIVRQGQNLILWDLGSSNGTYLNGARISPHQHHLLRDGDELSLGRMGLRIHFEPPCVN